MVHRAKFFVYHQFFFENAGIFADNVVILQKSTHKPTLFNETPLMLVLCQKQSVQLQINREVIADMLRKDCHSAFEISNSEIVENLNDPLLMFLDAGMEWAIRTYEGGKRQIRASNLSRREYKKNSIKFQPKSKKLKLSPLLFFLYRW